MISRTSSRGNEENLAAKAKGNRRSTRSRSSQPRRASAAAFAASQLDLEQQFEGTVAQGL
jgi:hypothetical protein